MPALRLMFSILLQMSHTHPIEDYDLEKGDQKKAPRVNHSGGPFLAL